MGESAGSPPLSTGGTLKTFKELGIIPTRESLLSGLHLYDLMPVLYINFVRDAN